LSSDTGNTPFDLLDLDSYHFINNAFLISPDGTDSFQSDIFPGCIHSTFKSGSMHYRHMAVIVAPEYSNGTATHPGSSKR